MIPSEKNRMSDLKEKVNQCLSAYESEEKAWKKVKGRLAVVGILIHINGLVDRGIIVDLVKSMSDMKRASDVAIGKCNDVVIAVNEELTVKHGIGRIIYRGKPRKPYFKTLVLTTSGLRTDHYVPLEDDPLINIYLKAKEKLRRLYGGQLLLYSINRYLRKSFPDVFSRSTPSVSAQAPSE